jgi:hypothetical protein
MTIYQKSQFSTFLKGKSDRKLILIKIYTYKTYFKHRNKLMWYKKVISHYLL